MEGKKVNGPQSFVKITIVLDLYKDHINHYNSLVLFWIGYTWMHLCKYKMGNNSDLPKTDTQRQPSEEARSFCASQRLDL